ncbi:hypothetical protein ST37_01380 (plasmid) [Vibrio sp. qd031]|uniref:ADP-ribosylglycohydrolase family protein n=1 Tax=Vibrio sp. qd031 TaxID=1603038 RepID=UPI000A106917|nr:ADP-ribosylglycohydrolase family protein [Vibrio sp. qd031]ORT52461.1 hypothetical protein ST37_01380 [Vibrio sp. qd031]
MKQDDTAIHLRAWHAIVGALVADAACMGFHFLNDQQKIVDLANDAPEFYPSTVDDYASTNQFVHNGKQSGDLTHYGAQMLSLIDSLVQKGRYVESAYISSYRRWFDFGGQWQGFIDQATKQTLMKIHHLEDNDLPFIGVGANSATNLALTVLPPIVTRYYQEEELLDWVETAVRVTNNNDIAVEYAKGVAVMLRCALLGYDPKECLKVAHRLGGLVAKDIDKVLIMRQSSSREVAVKVGSGSQLSSSFVVICHLMFHAKTYQQAIRENIYCGGDSSGRAIALGAILAACYQGTDKALPTEWIEKTDIPQNAFAL